MADKFTPLKLADFLPYRLVNLGKQVSGSLAGIYQRDYDLSIPEWRVMAILGERGETLPKEVAALTYMDKAKVSRAVKELARKQLIEKKPHGTDRRAYYLYLTEKGHELYQAIVPRALAWEAELLEALDGAEYRDLLRIIGKLADRLNGKTAKNSVSDGAQEQA